MQQNLLTLELNKIMAGLNLNPKNTLLKIEEGRIVFFNQVTSESIKRPMTLEKNRIRKFDNKEVTPVKKSNTYGYWKYLMDTKKLKQNELADFLGCSHQRISELYIRKPNASKWRLGELKKAILWCELKGTKIR